MGEDKKHTTDSTSEGEPDAGDGDSGAVTEDDTSTRFTTTTTVINLIWHGLGGTHRAVQPLKPQQSLFERL